jgi:probable HAF family extracellular repeat protein
MKRNIGTAMLVIALTGFATLAEAQTVSWPPPHYAVTNLGTLGGSQSNGYGGVTNDGWVSGDSYLPGDKNEHAVLWRDGVMIDLGSLAQAPSGVAWPQKNNGGLFVGGTSGPIADPQGENWGVAAVCGTRTGLCIGYQNLSLGFRWQNGVMTPLYPPPGGNNSEATGDNNLGYVVGLAEPGAVDLKCSTSPTNQPPYPSKQKLVINAVVWEPSGNVPTQQLLPLGDDDLSAATGINDNGDVVGLSGTCGTPDTSALAKHAVLWPHGPNGYGSAVGLLGLGGEMNNIAIVINDTGLIAGYSDLSGDTEPGATPTPHAVLWKKGPNGKYDAATDLGTLPGDVLSMSQDMNASGQVVGLSCDAGGNCRAFLWENGGGMIDLNSLMVSSLTPPRFPLYLYQAEGINDSGEIAGSACVPGKSTCEGSLAFLAKPVPTGQITGASAQKMTLPANIRASLQRRLRLGHFGVGPTAQQ